MNGYPTLYYESRFNDATPVASSTASGDYNVSYLTDYRRFTYWRPNAMPADVRVNSGQARAADYGVLFGHDLGSQGATVQLQGSTDNFATSIVTIASATPANDDPILFRFNSTSYQYWRYYFTGASVVTIALALIGVALAFPRRLRVGYDPLGRRVHNTINRSNAGHALGSTVKWEELKQRLSFRNLNSETWLRTTWLPAWRAHLRDTAVLFAWDPVNHPTEMRLVNIERGFQSPHQVGQFSDFQIEISGVMEQ